MAHRTAAAATPLAVGVGALGCELAARCEAAAGRRRLLDLETARLAAYDPAEALSLGPPGDEPDEIIPESLEQAAEEAAATLVADVRVGDVADLLGAVGEQTGAVVLPILARELRAERCTIVVIALEPQPFEGAARTDTAAQSLDELEEIADLVLPVPNRPLTDVCDPFLPVAKALECVKRKAVDAVEHLLGALADGACVGLQPAELRRALTEAGRGAIGVGTGRGENRIEDALRDACANSFLTQESCQKASAALLHLCGGKDLTLQEVYSATELVAHIAGDVAIQAGLSTRESTQADRVQAMLLVTGIHTLDGNGTNAQVASPTDHAHDLSFYDGVNLDVPAFMRRRRARRTGR